MSVFGGVAAVCTSLIMQFAQYHYRSMDATVSLITKTDKCESVLSEDIFF